MGCRGTAQSTRALAGGAALVAEVGVAVAVAVAAAVAVVAGSWGAAQVDTTCHLLPATSPALATCRSSCAPDRRPSMTGTAQV